MAMLKTNGFEIEGKIGGTIFRYDQCGGHAQSEGRYIDREPSLKQLQQQKYFRICHDFTQHNATPHFVQCWSHYGYQFPKWTCKGTIYYSTWWNMFKSFNMKRLRAGLPISPLPPGYPDSPP